MKREESEKLHAGHRERLRRRIENESLDYFEQHEVLELLLYYVMRQGDTNALAHALIDRFGSLAKVFDASRAQLEEVEGVGENVSFFIHMLPQVCRRYMLSRVSDRKFRTIATSDQAHEILSPYFIGRTVETLYILCLNSLGEPIEVAYISEGTANATSLNIRKILRIVLENNATAVVLCHNHPGGIAKPSKQDVQLTRRLAAVLDEMNVILLDHLIVVDGDFISFRDSEIGAEEETEAQSNETK